MADLATLQLRLAEAETALHTLAVTGRTVQIQFEGRMKTYSTATMGELRAYIDRLRQEIADAQAAAAGRRRIRQIQVIARKGFGGC